LNSELRADVHRDLRGLRAMIHFRIALINTVQDGFIR